MRMSYSEMFGVHLGDQNTIYHSLGNEECKDIPARWPSEIGLLLPASKAYRSYVMYDDSSLSRNFSLASLSLICHINMGQPCSLPLRCAYARDPSNLAHLQALL